MAKIPQGRHQHAECLFLRPPPQQQEKLPDQDVAYHCGTPSATRCQSTHHRSPENSTTNQRLAPVTTLISSDRSTTWLSGAVNAPRAPEWMWMKTQPAVLEGSVEMPTCTNQRQLDPPPLIIAGSGRSGTTWVLDVLARTFRLRPIFEPLNPHAIKGAEAYAWRHVPPGTDIAEMDAFFRAIFTGDLSSCWTDLRFHPSDLLPPPDFFRRKESAKLMLHHWIHALNQYRTYAPSRARSRIIVKFIRANLLLGWLAQHFGARILLLVRHPGAVVESKLRLGGISWDPATLLGTYRQDETIRCLRGGVYRDSLARKLTPAQALALHWCIENQLPIAEAQQNGYLLVHYEDLVEGGGTIWDRIAQFFDLSTGVWDQDLLTRPSQQASAAWRDNELAIDSHQSWRQRIHPKDLEDIQSILTATGETIYSAYEPLPRRPTAG